MVPPRNRTLATLGVLAVALGGCGGGSSPSGESAKVRGTLVRVLHALGSGDGATVCSLATSQGRQRLAGALPHSTCEQVVHLVGEHLSPSQKAALESVEVGKVEIHGGRATVPDRSITSARGSLKGFLQAGSAPTRLTRQSDGSWKISG